MKNKDTLILENLYEAINPELKDNEFQVKVPVYFDIKNNVKDIEFEKTEAFITYAININYASWGIHYINGHLVKVSPIKTSYNLPDGQDTPFELNLDSDTVEFLFAIEKDGQVLPNHLNVFLDENLKVVSASVLFNE
jgi:hypothetical protein